MYSTVFLRDSYMHVSLLCDVGRLPPKSVRISSHIEVQGEVLIQFSGVNQSPSFTHNSSNYAPSMRTNLGNVYTTKGAEPVD